MSADPLDGARQEPGPAAAPARDAEPADPWQGRHPKDRAIEPDDPMAMLAEPVDGDPLLMLDSLVEEYARLGWDAGHIDRVFDSPFFQATWGLSRLFGPDVVRARIREVLARCGTLRFRTTFDARVAAECVAPEVPDVLAVPPGPLTEASRAAPPRGGREAAGAHDHVPGPTACDGKGHDHA